MHIEFKRIILHNFMSFGDADLKFTDDGFIKVSGVNENPLDNAGSNGSGKSSLWEAIIWSITGETIRGTKQIVNIHGDDGCFVDIEFCIDNKQYRLIRSKDHKVYKTNLQIFIDGQDVSGKGLRDSEKLIQQYLPDLTASLLGSVIILGQGLPQKFTNNTPSGRKEVLESLSKSDFMIEDLKQRVAQRKINLTSDIRTYEDTNIQLTSEQKYLTEELTKAQSLLEKLDKSELLKQSEEFDRQLDEAENQLNSVCAETQQLQDRHNQLSITISDLSEQELSELNICQSKYQDNIKSDIDLERSLQIELQAATKQLAQLQNVTDVCPTCGQKLPDVHKPDTSSLEQSIQEITQQLSKVTTYLDKLKTEYNKTRADIQTRFLDEKTMLKADIQSVSEELTKLKRLSSELTNRVKECTRLCNENALQLMQIDALISSNQKIIIENNEKLSSISDKFMYNNMQKDLAQSHLDVVSKFETALKRDFRGYLLSTVIKYIEDRAKQYCKVIFDTTNIDFCLDGNNIDIRYMNKAYENLSGGEKQKIDLIIQFSIRDMLSSQLNFTSNILVLDEVFDGLDIIGCNRVINMINGLTDVNNVFVVTHRSDLSIPNDKDLIVAKSSAGISRIL